MICKNALLLPEGGFSSALPLDSLDSSGDAVVMTATNLTASTPSSPSAVGEGQTPAPAPRVPLRRPRTIVALLVVLLVVGGAWPAYRLWHSHRTKSFKAACVTAVRNKSWDDLERLASQWVAWDPASNDGWVYLSEASVQHGNLERAADSLGHVSNDYHGALEALATRAELLFYLNRPYDAAAAWQRMLVINPQADLARQRLIYFYSMSLRRSEMLSEIRQAIELQCEPPESYAYYLLAYDLNFSDGLSVTARWRERYPDDETLEVAHAVYLAKYSKVKAQALFGQLTVAPGDVSLIDECLEKYPENLETLAFHIDSAIYEGDEERVLNLLGRAPPAAEADPRFWRFRGWYLSAQGLYEEAEAALRKSLELHPVDWRTWLTLASVLRRLQHPDAAKAAEIAQTGKTLQKELFELPTASALDRQLALRIIEYLKQTGPPQVRQALERRVQ